MTTVINKQEALKQYLDAQKWQTELVKERLIESESPSANFIPHNEIMQRQEKRLKAKLGI